MAAVETLIQDQEHLVDLVVLAAVQTEIIHHKDKDLLEQELLVKEILVVLVL